MNDIENKRIINNFKKMTHYEDYKWKILKNI